MNFAEKSAAVESGGHPVRILRGAAIDLVSIHNGYARPRPVDLPQFPEVRWVCKSTLVLVFVRAGNLRDMGTCIACSCGCTTGRLRKLSLLLGGLAVLDHLVPLGCVGRLSRTRGHTFASAGLARRRLNHPGCCRRGFLCQRSRSCARTANVASPVVDPVLEVAQALAVQEERGNAGHEGVQLPHQLMVAPSGGRVDASSGSSFNLSLRGLGEQLAINFAGEPIKMVINKA